MKHDGSGGCEGRCNDSRDADLGLEGFPEAIKSSMGDLQSFTLANLDRSRTPVFLNSSLTTLARSGSSVLSFHGE
jgi:hypothetical protein